MDTRISELSFEDFSEIAARAMERKLDDVRDKVLENLLKQGRSDISREQIDLTMVFPALHQPHTSIADFNDWLADAKVTVKINARKGATSSRAIRVAVAEGL